MSGARIDVRDLAVAYGARRVLEGIELEISGGELVGLLGPNGAGKSSLLRCISGVLQPDRGTILLDDVPLAEYDRSTLARRLAVVPSQSVLHFPLRVEELVALGRIPHEHPLLGQRPVDRAAVDAAIERVGIGHLRGRDVRQLSLGERQLVVLAMTVAQGARLMLLDEPTVHLDIHHQVAVMQLLADLVAKDGVTVLAVLHDVTLASHFFPRLLLLHEGRLVADGTPADVLTPDRVREVYDVDPQFISLAGAGRGTAAG